MIYGIRKLTPSGTYWYNARLPEWDRWQRKCVNASAWYSRNEVEMAFRWINEKFPMPLFSTREVVEMLNRTASKR